MVEDRDSLNLYLPNFEIYAGEDLRYGLVDIGRKNHIFTTFLDIMGNFGAKLVLIYSIALEKIGHLWYGIKWHFLAKFGIFCGKWWNFKIDFYGPNFRNLWTAIWQKLCFFSINFFSLLRNFLAIIDFWFQKLCQVEVENFPNRYFLRGKFFCHFWIWEAWRLAGVDGGGCSPGRVYGGVLFWCCLLEDDFAHQDRRRRMREVD